MVEIFGKGAEKMTLPSYMKWSDEDLQMTVARLSGWERGPKKDLACGPIMIAKDSCWHKKSDGEYNWQDNPPDFSNSLEAMQKAVFSVSPKKRLLFGQILMDNLMKKHGRRKDGIAVRMVTATARERAIAFIMACEEM